MAQPPGASTAPPPSSKLSDSMCAPQYAASLKCLDEANYDKSKCQDYFDAYKECKKQERELRLEANRKSKRFFLKFLQIETEQNPGPLPLMRAYQQREVYKQ